MLKGQDCVILLKLLANPEAKMTQRIIAKELNISLSEVNAGFKRLRKAGLLELERTKENTKAFKVNRTLSKEFLVHGLKYLFPASLGEPTTGIRTAASAPIFSNEVSLGPESVFVWPDIKGTDKGISLEPLYPTLPSALQENPDQDFYDLLVLIDAIRFGRTRERNIAIQKLNERI